MGRRQPQNRGLGGGRLGRSGAYHGLLDLPQSKHNRGLLGALPLAQAYAYSGHGDAAAKQLGELSTYYPNSDAAAFGELFKADMAYPRGQYKEALEGYSKLLNANRTPQALAPLALAGTAATHEASGQPQQAAAAAQRFLDAHPDHFLAPQVHAVLARSLRAIGQADQAKAALQKIALQYPGTTFAQWAQERLQAK